MARLPYVDPASAPERVRETLAGLAVPLNVFFMMAHAETNLRSLLRLGGTILSKQQLSGRLRELAILRIASISPARYEWVQHVPIAKAAGVTDVQVATLEADDPSADCFDARDRLVLRFTDEVARNVRASDETFGLMTKQFPPREIVELTLAIGYYMLIARLLETTGVDLEADAGTKVVDALK
ncbi:MAG: carboxymuconolactone decarboxylase family protein [Candidatus Binatia bacterium]